MFGQYPFANLDAAGEARAAELHRSSLIVDMMFHGPTGYRVFTEEMTARIQQHLETTGDRLSAWEFGTELAERMALAGEMPAFREQWDESGLTAGCRDLAWHTDEGALSALAHTQALLDGFPWLSKALTAADFRAAHERGEHVQFIASQHAARFGGARLDYLDFAYEFGLRMLLLTYNASNELGGGCTAQQDDGLTEHGKRVVRHMNERGIIVDVSHSGTRTTLDACALSDAPVIASHSAAYAVHPHDRAKRDDELEAIAATGGLVGVFALPVFLAAVPDPTIEHFLDHIDHIVKTVGVEHVGLGLDWPLSLPKWALREVTQPAALGGLGWRAEHALDDEKNLVGFDDYRDLPNITRGLVARGYSDDAIRALLGENFLRVFERVAG